MREILFRAKRLDCNEWIEGFYLTSPEFDNIGFAVITTDEPRKANYVKKETVGQYTGLTDKNGKKIFEGDIVSYTEEIETKSKGKETLKGIYKVEFEYCGFSPLDCLACNHLEIIGNIYDNPELLKGE